MKKTFDPVVELKNALDKMGSKFFKSRRITDVSEVNRILKLTPLFFCKTENGFFYEARSEVDFEKKIRKRYISIYDTCKYNHYELNESHTDKTHF